MEKIDMEDVFKNFENNLNNLDKLHNVIDTLLLHVEVLKNDKECPPRFIQKIKNQIDALKNISNDKNKLDITPVIYEQELILSVSYLEGFLKDCFVLFCEIFFEDLQHNKIDTKFKLIDLKEIDFDVKKIGELILKKENKYNFQNINSIKESLSLFNIDLDEIITKTENDRLHYFLECRHILVHKAGIIDKEFAEKTGVGRVSERVNVAYAELQEIHVISKKIKDNLKIIFHKKIA